LIDLGINIHFPDNHFDTCGDHEKKRKAKEDAEEEQVKKKARELVKNKQFWKSLENEKRVEEDGEEDLDLFDDPDLVEVNLLGSENLG
jgi:phenylacetate-coenzyme A ligase PaaK-like adenylate-forming protein